MSLSALPIFVKLAGRPVILIGSGGGAEAKRRLLERAGARIVEEKAHAALAIVVDDDAAVERLKARGVLVNAVDRPDLCDFTLPAIVDRDPVLVAIGTGGVSAGLAAALRQRLEADLPAGLGALAHELHAARQDLRARWPDPAERRRVIASALAESLEPGIASRFDGADHSELLRFSLVSPDPDELTLRQARALGRADRVFHRPDVPAAILARARADAERILCDSPPAGPGAGLSIDLAMKI